MSNDVHTFLVEKADKVATQARLRVESCRLELRRLLEGSRERYRDTLSDLDQATGSLPMDGQDPLAARLAALGRTESLRQVAEGFDTTIARLESALESVDEAAAALDGRSGRLSALHQPLELSLEAVAIQAQEEERYRLAREIHDGPAQILANVALQLEYISKLAVKDPARARDEMVTIQKDLRLAVGEVRRFMYDLRPPALAQQGVGPAVESHSQRVADRFGMEIAVRWDATSSLPPSWESAMFRIVQEALQNVVKHARATRVEIRAVERDDVLELSVTDNGKGFDTQWVQDLDPKHFGLAGMRARAQQMGATLEVSSSPGQGTTILLQVPLT